jgi:hypothetical protein
MRWAGYVAYMEQMRNTQQLLAWKRDGYLGDACVNERMVMKCILKKQGM